MILGRFLKKNGKFDDQTIREKNRKKNDFLRLIFSKTLLNQNLMLIPM